MNITPWQSKKVNCLWSMTCSRLVEEKGKKYVEMVWYFFFPQEYSGISVWYLLKSGFNFFSSQFNAHQAISSTLICLSGISVRHITYLGAGGWLEGDVFVAIVVISNMLSLLSIWTHYLPPSVGDFPVSDGQTFLRDISSVLVPSPP